MQPLSFSFQKGIFISQPLNLQVYPSHYVYEKTPHCLGNSTSQFHYWSLRFKFSSIDFFNHTLFPSQPLVSLSAELSSMYSLVCSTFFVVCVLSEESSSHLTLLYDNSFCLWALVFRILPKNRKGKSSQEIAP